jgi:hypothetical protein
VTDPNEFDEFRWRQVEKERRRQILVRVLDVLIGLALGAITAVVIKMIFY